MIPYARQNIEDADVVAVAEVLRSDFLTQGPVVPRFEERLARYCGAAHGVAVCNATSALHIAVAALGLKPGGLLWTSPISFVASANCGLYCGADVDFVDIDPRTYTISPQALEQKLREAQRAGRLPDVLVSVDFGGQPGDLAALADLRSRYGFAIVEDASHAVGATYRGQPVGNGRYADVTVFSFHPVKILTTAEGGMAVTNDGPLARKMLLLRSHGVTRDPSLMTGARAPWEYEQVDLGFNYRLTEIQAALGISQLKRLDSFLERRREIASIYDDAFRGTPVVPPYQSPDSRSAYHLYAIQVEDRRRVYERLRELGVAANVHYMPIYLQPFYAAKGFTPGYCPNAEAYYARALSLPMYAGLTPDDQSRVIDATLDAVAHAPL